MEIQEELFCEDGFDCYAWVEEALIEHSGRVADLAQLVPQLALLSQSLTRNVHATLHQLTVTSPQLQSQLEAMQNATLPLKHQLDAVVAHVGDSDANASWSSSHRKKEDARDLQHLVTLHDAKQKLQACSQALVEAAKWERNVRVCFASIEETGGVRVVDDVDSRDSTDALSLADRVREMRKSLEVLKEMPGADDRRATMESLCVQIEVKLKPKLVEYLREEHVPVVRIQSCLAIFTSIDRDEIVRDEYCRCRPGYVHRVWYVYSPEHHEQHQQEEEGSISGVHPTFAEWLETFYSEVLVMLQRERHHIREIFGAQRLEPVLVTLLQNTFSSLHASFHDRVKKGFQLTTLLRAFQCSTSFATQVVQLFRSLENDKLLDGVGDSTPVDVGGSVLTSIFDAYRPFFSEYSAYASAALTDDLLRLVPTFTALHREGILGDDELFEGSGGEGSLEEFSQRFEDASKEVWTLVDESMKHCYEFSAGAAFPEAIDAVSRAVHQFARALTGVMPSIRHFCKLGASDGTRPGGSSGGLVDVAPDWSKFHAALALLKACGTFESDLCAMEIRVKARVGEQLSHLLSSGGESDRHASSSSPLPSRKKERKFQQEHGGGSLLVLADLVDATQVVATVAKTWLHDDSTRHHAFLQFAHEFQHSFASSSSFEALSFTKAVLFDEAQHSLRGWIQQVQLLTFDTVFLPIARLLEKVPANESWTKTPDASLGDLPSFSALPQEYITMVADLLLSLLPQLEQFAESSSLEKASIASHGAQGVCVTPQWERLGALLALSEQEVASCLFIFDSVVNDVNEVNEVDEEANGVQDTQETSTANDFVDLWTSAVASGTLATLLCAICAIPTLSDLGAKQLSADLSYFHNVLSAVGGEQNFLVDDLRHSLELSIAEHVQHVDTLRGEHGISSSQVLYKLNACLVTKRQAAGASVKSNGKPHGNTPSQSVTSQFY